MGGQRWEGQPGGSADASQEVRRPTEEEGPQCPGSRDWGGERDRERSMSAFSHNTRGLRSKIKVAAWSVSGESSFLSCRWPLLTVSSHGMRRDGEKGREGEGERETERTSSLASLLIRTLIPSQGPHLHDLI